MTTTYDDVRTTNQNVEDMLDLALDVKSEEEAHQDIPRTIEGLPLMARNLRKIERHIAMIAAYQEREINRIKESCQHRINGLKTQTGFWRRLAEDVLRMSGFCYANPDGRKYEMPGIGLFRFTTTREKVDSTQYDNMTEDAKAALHSKNGDLFNIKTTIAPDKKAIMARLQEGEVIDGFTLTDKQEILDFKEN